MDVEGPHNQAANDAARRFLDALERARPGSWVRAEQVAILATAAGERLGLRDDHLRVVALAGLVHELAEPPAGDRDWLQRTMAGLTAQPELMDALPLLLGRFERWDGRGEPLGLAGDAIPLGSRLIAAAVRMVGAGRGDLEAGIESIAALAGSELDPRAVEALREAWPLVQPVA